MSDQARSFERPEMTEEARRIWDANACWWDDRIGDGNEFQLQLIEPSVMRLLGEVAGQTVLEAACGAGRFSRLLAARGASVVGFDFSSSFIERAHERKAKECPQAPLEYHVIDGADEASIIALGLDRFDAAVCSMALMDMPQVEPLFRALARVLRPAGRLVFSISHPCFSSSGVSRFAEMDEGAQRCTIRTGVLVTKYLTPAAFQGEGIVGQPRPQLYFHRPLSMLLGSAFRAGFVVDGVEEPALSALPPDDARYLRQDAAPEIPRVLACRLRLR